MQSIKKLIFFVIVITIYLNTPRYTRHSSPSKWFVILQNDAQSFHSLESFKLEVLITGVVKEDFWGRKPLSWFVIGDDQFVVLSVLVAGARGDCRNSVCLHGQRGCLPEAMRDRCREWWRGVPGSHSGRAWLGLQGAKPGSASPGCPQKGLFQLPALNLQRSYSQIPSVVRSAKLPVKDKSNSYRFCLVNHLAQLTSLL